MMNARQILFEGITKELTGTAKEKVFIAETAGHKSDGDLTMVSTLYLGDSYSTRCSGSHLRSLRRLARS